MMVINMKKYKVSVIVPVYNAEDYLERCLDSVCNQTLKDIEIICVDDCSTDNSLDVLNKYAEKHKQIKIICHDKNQGESASRNTAFKEMNGEYVGFVDGDDAVDLDFFEKLYNGAMDTAADIVKGDMFIIDYSGRKLHDNIGEEIKKYNNILYFITRFTTAIYKSSVINENNIEFAYGVPLGADALFLNNIILASKSIHVVDNAFYHYHKREDSMDSKILPKNRVLSGLSVFSQAANNLNTANVFLDNPNGYDYAFYNYALNCIKISFRNDEETCKYMCAKTFIDIYKNCKRKNELDAGIMNEVPVIFKILKDNDVKELGAFLCKNNTMEKVLISTLRFKMKKTV